jgi:hypothetical protein
VTPRAIPTEEARLNGQIRAALPLYPFLRLWRNNTGKRGGVRFGLAVGSADWVGLLRGRFVAVEAKGKFGETTPEQDAWLADTRKRGGFACVVRSIGEFHAAVKRMMRGDNE